MFRLRTVAQHGPGSSSTGRPHGPPERSLSTTGKQHFFCFCIYTKRFDDYNSVFFYLVIGVAITGLAVGTSLTGGGHDNEQFSGATSITSGGSKVMNTLIFTSIQINIMLNAFYVSVNIHFVYCNSMSTFVFCFDC